MDIRCTNRSSIPHVKRIHFSCYCTHSYVLLLRHGRTYMYFKGEPQYPFGYGSSYTTFELDNLRTSAGTLDSGGSIGVTGGPAPNRGSRRRRRSRAVVCALPASKVERPLKQLRGFQRVTAQAGETKTVSLELRAADLSYWSPEGHAWVVEPGPVELLIGNSSSDKALTLRKTITVRPAELADPLQGGAAQRQIDRDRSFDGLGSAAIRANCG